MKKTPSPKDKDRDSLVSTGGSRKYVQVSCSAHHCCAIDTNGKLGLEVRVRVLLIDGSLFVESRVDIKKSSKETTLASSYP